VRATKQAVVAQARVANLDKGVEAKKATRRVNRETPPENWGRERMGGVRLASVPHEERWRPA